LICIKALLAHVLPFIQWPKRELTVILRDQQTDAQQWVKQKRKAEGKSRLHLKKQEMDKAKVRDRQFPCFVLFCYA
jgi:hypothetical protein